MTKEQKVAIDAMREAWPADAVERMLRAEKAEPLMFRAIEQISHEDCGYCGRRFNDHRDECTECAPVKAAIIFMETGIVVSPAETRTGASAHRPPGETTHDPTCPRAVGAPLLCRCGVEPEPGTPPAQHPAHDPNPS